MINVNNSCDYIPLELVSTLNVADNDLITVQLNIRGLISKQIDLTKLLANCLSNSKIDVIMLCETWVTPDTKGLINIPGYQFVGKERMNKKGGGIGLLILNELKYKIRNILCMMTDHFECFTIEIAMKGRNILCTSVYRPPNTNAKAFLHDMNKMMELMKLETCKDSIIGMDHNLNFLKHTSHLATENFINLMLENGSFPCITRPTRVTKTMATLIDNVFLSYKLYENMKCSVIMHDISDHFPRICIVANVKVDKKSPVYTTYHDITDCNIDSVQNELSSVNWYALLEFTNTNTSYTCFHSILTKSLDTHIPIIEKRVLAKQFLCEPWLTNGLIKCRKKQLKLFEKSVRSGNESDLLVYKNYKSTLQRIKR